ncbi:MAG TPA: cbb3-type cytochrome c oxidase subunit I, partial [Bauldia sp.]|nr:cbb3-type cytochrome c oxidase subunit I [Bauldia sp.]
RHADRRRHRHHARGAAALSTRAATDKPIKLLGVGEKLDALEDFDPKRIAGRILGMGDIVGLVEKAAQTMDAEKAARAAERMRKGVFTLDDLSEQLCQMQKIGGMPGVLLAVPPADFSLHNSLFLIAHFHNVIIGGVLFGLMAGISYWFPKAFGYKLDPFWG